MGNSLFLWWFSIAMLNYQRVPWLPTGAPFLHPPYGIIIYGIAGWKPIINKPYTIVLCIYIQYQFIYQLYTGKSTQYGMAGFLDVSMAIFNSYVSHYHIISSIGPGHIHVREYFYCHNTIDRHELHYSYVSHHIILKFPLKPINHSYWSYLYQLSYRLGAPPCSYVSHHIISSMSA